MDGWMERGRREERKAGRRKYKRMGGERASATVRQEGGRDKLGSEEWEWEREIERNKRVETGEEERE